MVDPRRVAVIGGGWAGLAAAVDLTRLGHQVVLYEMAPQLGGRAREVVLDGVPLDNGQHILIGAYTQTLSLLRQVGVDVDRALLRTPLSVVYPDGSGLELRAGPPIATFTLAVLRSARWRWRDKLALLATTTRWALSGFRCDASLTVEQLIGPLPKAVRHDLLDPLCVAALNTPAAQASAAVFLRVLKDALFSGPGSADLLLPRRSLSELWPRPAAGWLEAAGASIRMTSRVESIETQQDYWSVNGEPADAIVLACSANEAARLTASCAPAWSGQAATFTYEPIVTVYARSDGAALPHPMMALRSNSARPAQFVIDLGALTGNQGLLALVVSGAAQWVAKGRTATTEAALNQARQELSAHLREPLNAVHTVSEKRATFLCKPGLQRPAQRILPGLYAAGDYVDGPYPATLEGATRSGINASAEVDFYFAMQNLVEPRQNPAS